MSLVSISNSRQLPPHLYEKIRRAKEESGQVNSPRSEKSASPSSRRGYSSEDLTFDPSRSPPQKSGLIMSENCNIYLTGKPIPGKRRIMTEKEMHEYIDRHSPPHPPSPKYVIKETKTRPVKNTKTYQLATDFKKRFIDRCITYKGEITREQLEVILRRLYVIECTLDEEPLILKDFEELCGVARVKEVPKQSRDESELVTSLEQQIEQELKEMSAKMSEQDLSKVDTTGAEEEEPHEAEIQPEQAASEAHEEEDRHEEEETKEAAADEASNQEAQEPPVEEPAADVSQEEGKSVEDVAHEEEEANEQHDTESTSLADSSSEHHEEEDVTIVDETEMASDEHYEEEDDEPITFDVERVRTVLYTAAEEKIAGYFWNKLASAIAFAVMSRNSRRGSPRSPQLSASPGSPGAAYSSASGSPSQGFRSSYQSDYQRTQGDSRNWYPEDSDDEESSLSYDADETEAAQASQQPPPSPPVNPNSPKPVRRSPSKTNAKFPDFYDNLRFAKYPVDSRPRRYTPELSSIERAHKAHISRSNVSDKDGFETTVTRMRVAQRMKE